MDMICNKKLRSGLLALLRTERSDAMNGVLASRLERSHARRDRGRFGSRDNESQVLGAMAWDLGARASVVALKTGVIALVEVVGRGQAFNILESRLERLFVVSFQLAHLFSGSSLRSCR